VKLRDRASYAFALASAAAAVVVEGGIVTEARIALGGVATVPWRAPDAEASLIGRPLTPETAAAAGRIALPNARPGRQNRFRIDLAAAAVAEALITAGTRS
jgi:xanthine dehydrogenase YagS FAD-binding subunit